MVFPKSDSSHDFRRAFQDLWVAVQRRPEQSRHSLLRQCLRANFNKKASTRLASGRLRNATPQPQFRMACTKRKRKRQQGERWRTPPNNLIFHQTAHMKQIDRNNNRKKRLRKLVQRLQKTKNLPTTWLRPCPRLNRGSAIFTLPEAESRISRSKAPVSHGSFARFSLPQIIRPARATQKKFSADVVNENPFIVDSSTRQIFGVPRTNTLSICRRSLDSAPDPRIERGASASRLAVALGVGEAQQLQSHLRPLRGHGPVHASENV